MTRDEELRAAALEVLAKCENYFEEYGAQHLDGCPEDDTCACPLVVELNAAFKRLDQARGWPCDRCGGIGSGCDCEDRPVVGAGLMR